jgi:ADP-heptose:LPS heptosyltransferase/tetratricopeptide (TPR) repeat protein
MAAIQLSMQGVSLLLGMSVRRRLGPAASESSPDNISANEFIADVARDETKENVFIGSADRARDERRFRDAAALYAEALRLEPDLGPIHVQAGHMFKEAGEFEQAEHHYNEALKLMPDDADLTLQLGHFYKVLGRPDRAHVCYTRAVELAPVLADATAELEALNETGVRDRAYLRATREQPVIIAEDLDPEGRPDDLKLAPLYGRLAPELLPRSLRELLHYGEESINIRQLGFEQRTFWGHRQVVRGIEAIRGFVISKVPVLELQARVNGLPIHRGPLKGPFELEYEPDKDRIHKYVFNFWFDFSNFAHGLYELELSFKVAGQGDRQFRQEFVVEAPLLEVDHPESDALINLPPDGEGSIEAQIKARPSVVREAERPNQLGEVRSVLVARTDQLGDLVASVPGILRLRDLFPQATIVGMFGPANVGLARSLNVFDDIIVVDHRESWHQRVRTLSLLEQQEIRDKCAPYHFDLAIDLSVSLMGRPLLMLSGARLLCGYREPHWPRLALSCNDDFLDPKNRKENAAHSKRIVAMIERLGTLSRATAKIIRRDDLSPDLLRRYGIQEGERFATLHTGARIVWSRWAHYLALASRLLKDTDLKVVLFTEDPGLRNKLPPDLAGSDRLIILDGHLPFDDFDALLSFCSVYVGNDSGPKHLASLRGVPVVSIHSSRLNWSEWGQEQTGVIISRKVPCAGCHIYHDSDECGKDYACMKISVQEVYDAVRRYV